MVVRIGSVYKRRNFYSTIMVSMDNKKRQRHQSAYFWIFLLSPAGWDPAWNISKRQFAHYWYGSIATYMRNINIISRLFALFCMNIVQHKDLTASTSVRSLLYLMVKFRHSGFLQNVRMLFFCLFF